MHHIHPYKKKTLTIRLHNEHSEIYADNDYNRDMAISVIYNALTKVNDKNNTGIWMNIHQSIKV